MEWLQDEFREDSNRDQIGRTEDVTLGWRARAQLGYAGNSVGSDVDAAMLSAAVAKGVELTARQTLQFEAAAAGRIEGGDLVGGLLSAEARYYFRQSPRRVLFMGLSTLAGSNLDPDQQILLGGDSGLRGYPLRYQAGTGRWLFTAEQRFYSNWYPFRLFNVGGAAFFDVGETWGRDPLGRAVPRPVEGTWASACVSATAVLRSATSCMSIWPCHSMATPRSRTSSS
jgi:hypothetical protein